MIIIVAIIVFLSGLFLLLKIADLIDNIGHFYSVSSFFIPLIITMVYWLICGHLLFYTTPQTALKHCNWEPAYSHSRHIYKLQDDYITEYDDNNYLIYVSQSDGNNIEPKIIPKDKVTIIDVDTNMPYLNYYAPHFSNKLINLYFCGMFTINQFDICI